jgi:two-component system sensor histidine kinase CreC
MNIRTRIFIGILIVIVVGFSFFLRWIVDDLEPEYRKATEEPLVDSARILASVASAAAINGKIDSAAFERIFENYSTQRHFYARIYDYLKTESDIRVYITDASGIVIFDSYDSSNEGKDFSKWLDVFRTLRGEYGARTTRDIPSDSSSSVMYVASPIIINGKIAGVLSVGKPTRAARLFTEKSQRKIVTAGIVVLISMLLVAGLLSGMIINPIKKLTKYARAVRDGKNIAMPSLGTGEIAELGSAFEEMRDALEGKQYIERYVRTLAHEVKSPLSAIRGATDLLNENMAPEQQKYFIDNIRIESERIESIIEKLLLLSSLESKKTIRKTDLINVHEIVQNLKQSLLPILEGKRLQLEITSDTSCAFEGDTFLISHAVANLLQNAIDFSPVGSKISANIFSSNDSYMGIEIKDSGTGIPEYALDKVYERFYSLKRPDTGKKSSGLGLSLVKEIALLHNGTIELSNTPEGGTKAVLRFPVRYN